jgi:hypothetical protein
MPPAPPNRPNAAAFHYHLRIPGGRGEWIAVEVVYLLAEYLIKHYTTDVQAPAMPPGSPAQYDVPVFQVPLGIPLANAGRYTCPLANNQTGVDLNRNLVTLAWGYDGLGYPEIGPPQPTETGDPLSGGYLGPAAGSEVETSNVQIAMADAAAALGIGIQAFPMAWNMLQFMTWNVYNRGNQLPL